MCPRPRRANVRGILSLMQLAKTSGALAVHAKAGLP